METGFEFCFCEILAAWMSGSWLAVSSVKWGLSVPTQWDGWELKHLEMSVDSRCWRHRNTTPFPTSWSHQDLYTLCWEKQTKGCTLCWESSIFLLSPTSSCISKSFYSSFWKMAFSGGLSANAWDHKGCALWKAGWELWGSQTSRQAPQMPPERAINH